ncbi:hypothetical protein [Arsenicibacter rosenii]|uniref:Viral A-type inclusion protein n=1 Tax=Arsenicibacter rosenii TaxID=1750698 RepID=A0A1S2VGU7_9BACT|nr:hypothetical protein [Arsenicibacter rosenii]OIN57426.1 hypothetical protein BLX24_19540 [Arsenicibacter rosenii]
MNKLVLSFSVTILASGFLFSCGDSGQQEAIDKTEKEVFAVHDEVMPKIGEIMKLRKELNQLVGKEDSLAATSASATLLSDEKKAQASLLSRQLGEADSLMMAWMNGYNADTLKKLESADALRYLEQEKGKVTNVKEKINSSIADARRFLGKP